ncbi:MAG: hypothetical protein AB7P37_19685 [Ramlibacter sp.]
MVTNIKTFSALVLLVVANALAPAAAQQTGAGRAPVSISGAVKAIELPAAPAGMAWWRIEEIDVAVPVPDGWKQHRKDGPSFRTFAFSDQPLDRNGLFERGLTVTLLWLPQLPAGSEAQATEIMLRGLAAQIQKSPDNKVLTGTLEEKSGKRVMVIRYRNAPSGIPPIIVHTMFIGDPRTGLVYQIIYEGPEATWEDNWKIGEQILKRVYVAFQAG